MQPASSLAPHSGPPPEPFSEEVRAALDHLYDSAFLHNHPLAWQLYGDAPASGISRAQRLRTSLLDAIEQLRPDPRFSTDEMRAYAILTYRCMDGMTMDEIAAKLGLSRRQAYREYAKAVDAVAGLFWELLPPLPAELTSDLAAADTGAGATAATALEPAESTRRDAATQEVARLTNNLLLEPLDLPALARSVADLLAPRVEQTGVTLHLAQAELLPTVAADRALLRQALLNLFSYALDQPCRGGEVTVTWTQGAREVTLWLAACAGEQPAKREGIGVSIAQKLIAAMGGQVQVEQGAGEWRCSLALPVDRCGTVLVVDDNADLTALFQRYAAGHQLNVAGATSGAQALDLAKELRPQLILLDLMLSPMDGWEILQQLRHCPETQDTPIVICSVLNEPDLAFSLGASDYVTKPISQASLVDVLRRWLGKRHPAV